VRPLLLLVLVMVAVEQPLLNTAGGAAWLLCLGCHWVASHGNNLERHWQLPGAHHSSRRTTTTSSSSSTVQRTLPCPS